MVQEITQHQAEILKKYFIADEESFDFEGCWLRNQRPENAKKSGYVDETTKRRRYVHFYDSYVCEEKNGKYYLALSKYYLYVTNTLPKDEIERYYKRIQEALEIGHFALVKKNVFEAKNGTQVQIFRYKDHPRNVEPFPANYESLDIVVCSNGYDYSAIQDRMWALSKKMYRNPDVRGNPIYTNNVADILKYLPAQIEMGCGPSINANIPPLHDMHETYKVQNHISGKFYFADQDDLLYNVISNENEMRKKFAKVPLACISAELTEGYKAFGEIYKKGYFRGTVFNNNFDRLVKRMDIPEKILRVYDINEYIAQCDFDPEAKVLICMGCHADRRQVQRQARKNNMQIIYIDPEGFYTKDGFEPYPIEGPQDGDIILKMTFEEAMNKLGEILK